MHKPASVPQVSSEIGNEFESEATYEPRRREKIMLHVVNKSVDQPAHPRSLISAFVVRYLQNIVSKLST